MLIFWNKTDMLLRENMVKVIAGVNRSILLVEFCLPVFTLLINGSRMHLITCIGTRKDKSYVLHYVTRD